MRLSASMSKVKQAAQRAPFGHGTGLAIMFGAFSSTALVGGFGASVEDEAYAVQKQLCGENRSHAGRVVRRGDFDEIHPYDPTLSASRERLNDFQHLIVKEAAVAGRPRPWRDGRIEA